MQPNAFDVVQSLSAQVGFLNIQVAEKDSIIRQLKAQINELENQNKDEEKE